MPAFVIGQTYTRPQVYEIFTGKSIKRTTGTWNKGWVIHDGEGIVFANVGVAGQGGYDYANEWLGTQLIWETTKLAAQNHKNVVPLLQEGSQSHIFTRTSNTDAWTYAGRGAPADVNGNWPQIGSSSCVFLGSDK